MPQQWSHLIVSHYKWSPALLMPAVRWYRLQIFVLIQQFVARYTVPENVDFERLFFVNALPYAIWTKRGCICTWNLKGRQMWISLKVLLPNCSLSDLQAVSIKRLFYHLREYRKFLCHIGSTVSILHLPNCRAVDSRLVTRLESQPLYDSDSTRDSTPMTRRVCIIMKSIVVLRSACWNLEVI